MVLVLLKIRTISGTAGVITETDIIVMSAIVQFIADIITSIVVLAH